MKSKALKSIWLIAAVCITLACSFSFTPVTSPTASVPTPEATIAATNGIAVSFSGTSFMIPNGLATGTSNEIKPRETADLGIPYLAHPDYIYFKLQGYPLQGKLFEPQISIYPVKEYTQINDSIQAVISNLQTVLAAKQTSPNEPIPFVPLQNANQDFHAQEKFLTFKNGTGIRFVTQFDQAPLPINNTSMFYTFQGLTTDGEYYVSVSLPVNLGYLPADDKPNSPTPPNGIPFDWEHIENFPNYLSTAVERLRQPDNSFQPQLETLDSLVESILAARQP